MPDTDQSFPLKVEPLSDAAEAGSLHSSGHDVELLRQTHAMARYANANRRTWFYHAPYDATAGETCAPFADLTSVNTWSTFDMGEFGQGDYTYQMPWMVSPTHDYVVFVIRVVTDSYHRFELRLSKSTFITSTSSETFLAPRIAITAPLMQPVPWQVQTFGKGASRYCDYTISTEGISLPSDRLVLFKPEIQVTNDVNGALLEEGGSFRFYIASITAVDVKEL